MFFLRRPTLLDRRPDRDLDRLQLVAADLERLLDDVIETGEQVLAQTAQPAPPDMSHSAQYDGQNRKRMIDTDG